MGAATITQKKLKKIKSEIKIKLKIEYWQS